MYRIGIPLLERSLSRKKNLLGDSIIAIYCERFSIYCFRFNNTQRGYTESVSIAGAFNLVHLGAIESEAVCTEPQEVNKRELKAVMLRYLKKKSIFGLLTFYFFYTHVCYPTLPPLSTLSVEQKVGQLLIEQCAYATAEELKAVGVNMTLGSVVDLNMLILRGKHILSKGAFEPTCKDILTIYDYILEALYTDRISDERLNHSEPRFLSLKEKDGLISDAWENSEQAAFIKRLTQNDKPVTIIALGDPNDSEYVQPDVNFIILTSSPDAYCIQPAVDTLTGVIHVT